MQDERGVLMVAETQPYADGGGRGGEGDGGQGRSGMLMAEAKAGKVMVAEADRVR